MPYIPHSQAELEEMLAKPDKEGIREYLEKAKKRYAI